MHVLLQTELVIQQSLFTQNAVYSTANLFMVALCNMETIYIFMLWFVLLLLLLLLLFFSFFLA